MKYGVWVYGGLWGLDADILRKLIGPIDMTPPTLNKIKESFNLLYWYSIGRFIAGETMKKSMQKIPASPFFR